MTTRDKPKLLFLSSLPRAGKSSWANKWVRLPGPRPRVIVSGDDIRTAMHGHAYIPEAEPYVFAHMDIAIRSHLLRGCDVIADETFTTEQSILRMLRIDIEAEPIFISTPVEVCKRRAIDAGKEYLLGPIDRMAAQLEKLKADWPETLERLKIYVRLRQSQDVTI